MSVLRGLLAIGFSLGMMAQFAGAADPAPAAPAAKAPAKAAEFTIGEMHLQTTPAMTCISGSAQTTFEKMMEVINKYMPMIKAADAEGKIHPAGPGMFVYRDMKDMTQPFTLDIGWVVAADSKDVGELKVRKLEAFKCATVLFTGPVNHLGNAYGKLIGQMATANLTPGTETREMYLYFEGVDSPNNVVQIQVGYK